MIGQFRKDRGTPQEDAIHVAKVAPFVFLIGLALLHLSGIMPHSQDQRDTAVQGQSSGR